MSRRIIISPRLLTRRWGNKRVDLALFPVILMVRDLKMFHIEQLRDALLADEQNDLVPDKVVMS